MTHLGAGSGSKVGPQHRGALEGAAFAIWTTTGWTLPANLAVAVNDKLQYAVVEVQVRRPCHAMCLPYQQNSHF